MKRKLAILLSSVLFLVSCASTRIDFLPNPISAEQMRKNPQDIEIMYDGPGRAYDVLGLLDCSPYQPGFGSPVLIELMPEIKFKAAQVGGDAVIVRRSESVKSYISVAAEVIRYRN